MDSNDSPTNAMDSEESRPGSSASNSSTNSSENSRHSFPIPTNSEDVAKALSDETKSLNNIERRSRSLSRISNDGISSPHTNSKSESDSSSSSSSSDNEQEIKSPSASTHRKSLDRSSSESSTQKHEKLASLNQSESSVKSRRSSRNSSLSSNESRSNSRDNRGSDDNTNISHDLSDVSDMESDKQAYYFNNSKQSLEEDATDIPSMPAAVAVEDEAESTQIPRDNSLERDSTENEIITDLRQKLDKKKNQASKDKANEKMEMEVNITNVNRISGEFEDLVKAHDEDALDFEAEEGECQDIVGKEDELKTTEINKSDQEKNYKNDKSDGEAEEGEELEEGEVSDEDEKRPEETEPKPVCRFYTRGQCTWGMSCRFLHPGVTDKGNYTMFDLVRPVSVPQSSTAGSRTSGYPVHAAEYHDYRTERPVIHHRGGLHHPPSIYPAHHDSRTPIAEGPVVVESAWERGLRTAKEMMRKANKRKEQDMDFEDKKMNLTLSPDELEKDPYYLKERSSPPENVLPYGRYGHGVYQDLPTGVHSPSERFGRGGPPALPYEEIDTYGRTTRYRELPPHRMPQYEDERRVRSTREVIVQRVEPVGRCDEWNDPWMRSKSPGGRGLSRERGDKRRRDRRSYSSNSSYSSSSSSQSGSSSDSSHSPSPTDHRRRYNSGAHKSPIVTRRHADRPIRSPTSPHRRSKRSPTLRHSPTAKRRGHLSTSPGLEKRSAYSPIHKRKKVSPILTKSLNDKTKTKHRKMSSSSGSGSSDSSASDSDSDSGSSSSDSSSRSRDRTSTKRSRVPERVAKDRKLSKKEPPKKRSPISIEIKKPTTVGTSALASSPTHSVSSEKDSKKSRREELLKQLRAVEDAIAKKRSKLA